MKKIILSLLLTVSIIPSSHAGFYDSDYFEPTLACAIGGAVGYTSASSGNELMNAGLYCAAGAVLGYVTNQYYRKKVDRVHENKISDIDFQIRERVIRQARKATLGTMDEYHSVLGKQIEEAQEDGAGGVISAGEKTILKAP
jgi:hypothetical protein